MSRPKIAHVITGLGTGGAETMLYKVLAQLDPLRFDSTVISLMPCKGLPIERKILDLGIEVHSLEMRPGRPQPWALVSFLRIIRALQPDLISGTEVHGTLAATAASFQDRTIPMVWNVVGSLDDRTTVKLSTQALIRILARASGRTKQIIYDSRSSARQHEAAGYDASRTTVIPNGFDCDRFRPNAETRASMRREMGVGADATLVGIVARFHPVKDHAVFLRSAARLAMGDSKLHFVMVGAGMTALNAPLMSSIREIKLESRISLLGERADVERIDAALDICCLTSRAEGFPNAIGEAMACGVPCVGTNVGDVAWIIGNTGRVAPPRNWEAFAAAVGELLEYSPFRRRELGAMARQRIVNEFDIQKVGRAYAGVYCSTIGTREPAERVRRQSAGGSSFA